MSNVTEIHFLGGKETNLIATDQFFAADAYFWFFSNEFIFLVQVFEISRMDYRYQSVIVRWMSYTCGMSR